MLPGVRLTVKTVGKKAPVEPLVLAALMAVMAMAAPAAPAVLVAQEAMEAPTPRINTWQDVEIQSVPELMLMKGPS